MKEKFLPIGSVVLLKDAKKEIMITSYCIIPTQGEVKDGELVKPEMRMFDYGACPYPEGVIDSNMICAFNNDQIDKVIYRGYESKEYKKLNESLNKNYDKIKEQVKKVSK